MCLESAQPPLIIMAIKNNRRYKEYLKSDEWDRVKSEEIDQANGICAACGWPLGNSIPHTHHTNYENLGREGTGDLEVLHKVCHERKHPDMKGVEQND